MTSEKTRSAADSSSPELEGHLAPQRTGHARGIWTWLGPVYGGISVAALTGALSLMLAGASAPAQALETLVNNFGQAEGGTERRVGWVGDGLRHQAAQKFTTGPNAAGYTVEVISAVFSVEPDPNDDANVKVRIYTSEAGEPRSLLHRFSNPFAIKVGINTFTAPENTTLDANTTYSAVFDSAAGADYTLKTTSASAEDDGVCGVGADMTPGAHRDTEDVGMRGDAP